MFERERVKQEKINTMDPEVQKEIYLKSVGFAAADFVFDRIEECIFGEENKQTFFEKVDKFHNTFETVTDLSNRQNFLNECREFEDKIEETADEQEKQTLNQSFQTYKNEWGKQTKRETEDREIRDKFKTLLKNLVS
ncbi:MAG: hypothetical protein CO001_01820 [Candidatus Portnoybacteria bacterium CG_4_8_14_3_um_filter_40_10]|uniref:Uncharacterized protein n=2 Tax=Candidatus Portnoyibacteriota TaxID=1817913 RepID=A0A2M7IIJ6_9BACT|nr:MAG: hypothetical protein COT41_04015 [Candidatus Portnoybacteria bacterium CG08_land_8_20_14_0_20_40_83]PIW76350.1 MAG: hypothetical protein CO001_01820 [Candidatus Portnoybacteria bacterium CG_4_8_14_3_um_filter_40_10]PIY74358.1 MAG: hypothetical protein COY85_03480 [Candidatus Portnoybacteria bacterium CG_4_10_14_0_8_um_filter_40_50]